MKSNNNSKNNVIPFPIHHGFNSSEELVQFIIQVNSIQDLDHDKYCKQIMLAINNWLNNWLNNCYR